MGRQKTGRSMVKRAMLWPAAVLLALAVAYPAWAVIFAPPGSVNTEAIVKGAVTSAKIKNKTIKNIDIAAGLNADKVDGKHLRDLIPRSGGIMTGLLAAPGFNYTVTKFGHVAVSPHAITPMDSNTNFTRNIGSIYSSDAGPIKFVAPVSVPDGVTMISFGVRINDANSSHDATAQLIRISNTDVQNVIAACATSGSSGIQQISAPVADGYRVVDNANYSYYVNFSFDNTPVSQIQPGKSTITYSYIETGR